MLGAIIGDIVGSRFEKNNHLSKDFQFIHQICHFTDDTVTTLAVGQALVAADGDWERLAEETIYWLRAYGHLYPDCGFGRNFRKWLTAEDTKPYNSYGNGAAMRVCGCAAVAGSLEEARHLSYIVTAVTHNHPEGIKGAEAVTTAIYLARTGADKATIRKAMCAYYPLNFTLESIRGEYKFDVTCQGSVPQAIVAFLEATDFVDAIRNAISIGGDSDTIAAITGSIAEAFFGIPETLAAQAMMMLPAQMQQVVRDFDERFPLALAQTDATNEECLICKAPLEYLQEGVLMECAICHKQELSKTRCVNGHYVCNECHTQGLDSIFGVCLSATGTDPVAIVNEMMALPFCHMHGPEHHIMVGMALLTACHNAGADFELKATLREMKNRGSAVPGGSCGFWGACGAGLSTGMAVSILTETTPLSTDTFGLSQKMTARALSHIGDIGGPRCCKRDSYLSLEEATAFINEHLHIPIHHGDIVCHYAAKNNQCLGKNCPFNVANHQ